MNKLIKKGYDALWLWFGLSYASFLILPRVLMHEMPDEWQLKMSKLLVEYDEHFKRVEGISSTTVCAKNDAGKFTSFPAYILNYRRPNIKEIDKLRKEAA